MQADLAGVVAQGLEHRLHHRRSDLHHGAGRGFPNDYVLIGHQLDQPGQRRLQLLELLAPVLAHQAGDEDGQVELPEDRLEHGEGPRRARGALAGTIAVTLPVLAVAEAAAIGVPHEVKGEAIVQLPLDADLTDDLQVVLGLSLTVAAPPR